MHLIPFFLTPQRHSTHITRKKTKNQILQYHLAYVYIRDSSNSFYMRYIRVRMSTLVRIQRETFERCTRVICCQRKYLFTIRFGVSPIPLIRVSSEPRMFKHQTVKRSGGKFVLVRIRAKFA